MQRIACEERADWRDTASKVGFAFHSLNGEPYWDESAYYAFTLDEIERDIEAPTAEIDAMCRELMSRAVDDERMLRALRIPERFWTLIAASWKRGDPSLYGRFDFAYDGRGPAKLLEYNADTPTSLFESAVFQWIWLEEASARKILPPAADQYNSLHECLVEAWATAGTGSVHLCGVIDNPEDAGTLAYLQDTAHQAGLATKVLAMDGIGHRPDGAFVDLDDQPIDCAFKLYPWEWMMQEEFGSALAGASTRWLEPPWKAILSNKGILPLLWELFPRHPNLLPAYFEDDAEAAKLGRSYARKPLYSREGANIALVVDGKEVDTDCGPYGREGHIRQALAPMPQFAGNYAVLSDRGLPAASRAASGYARTQARSPRTRPAFCRTRFSKWPDSHFGNLPFISMTRMRQTEHTSVLPLQQVADISGIARASEALRPYSATPLHDFEGV